MTSKEIEVFLAVVEKRNLSKAAASLYMSQSTLSNRLNLLEEELGASLFIRHKGQRTVEITPYGYNFIPIAERWSNLWREAQDLHAMHGSRSFYICTVASLSQCLFPRLYLKLLQEQSSKISLMIRSRPSFALYPAVESGEIQLAFAVTHSTYNNVICKPLFSEECVLLTGSDTLAESGVFGPDVHPKDLDPRREILYQFHPDYLRWRSQWYGNLADPALGCGDAVLLERFFSLPGDLWATVPLSIGLSIQKTCNVSLHHFVKQPLPRTCYMLTHRILNSSYQSCFDLFQAYLDQFLKEEENVGHLKILP